jgi:hypothetical protein
MTPATCIAYQDDGRRCRAPASILDHHRGGLVCLDHALDTYHCPTHGVRSRRRGEVRQAEVDEVCLYVCRACGQIADPTACVDGEEASPC